MQILEQDNKYFTVRLPIEFLPKVNSIFDMSSSSQEVIVEKISSNELGIGKKIKESDPFEDEIKIINSSKKLKQEDFMSFESFLNKAKKYALESRG